MIICPTCGNQAVSGGLNTSEPAAPVSPPQICVACHGTKESPQTVLAGSSDDLCWSKFHEIAPAPPEPPRCPRCGSKDKDTHYTPDAPVPQSGEPCPHEWHSEPPSMTSVQFLGKWCSENGTSPGELFTGADMADFAKQFHAAAQSLSATPEPVSASPEQTLVAQAEAFLMEKYPRIRGRVEMLGLVLADFAQSLSAKTPQPEEK